MATRVLAIDDEEDYRVILRDVLGEAGFEVRLAVDGSEGLAALKQFKPDVVLCDWMMPKLDGQAFVAQLRSEPAYKSLPVIMLTVKQTSNDELEALHFGVDDFIVKPFQSDDLLARIRAVLRRTKV